MGIGVTGYLQCTQEQKDWLPSCYTFLRDLDNTYSKAHGIPRSIKLTTIKPSGTLSLLGRCTAGVHPGFAPFYIRRIRVSSIHKLLVVARNHGYKVEQDFGDPTGSTFVVEFPYSLPKHTIFAKDCSAIQQLEYVRELQTLWSDNAVSVTVYYRLEELPEIKEWLRKNYNTNIKCVSFLLHSDHGFSQAPLEEITEEEYNSIVQKTKAIGLDIDGYSGYTEELNYSEECPGGHCPIR
jgi:ribonucleoside-triphosphate reductase